MDCEYTFFFGKKRILCREKSIMKCAVCDMYICKRHIDNHDCINCQEGLCWKKSSIMCSFCLKCVCGDHVIKHVCILCKGDIFNNEKCGKIPNIYCKLCRKYACHKHRCDHLSMMKFLLCNENTCNDAFNETCKKCTKMFCKHHIDDHECIYREYCYSCGKNACRHCKQCNKYTCSSHKCNHDKYKNWSLEYWVGCYDCMKCAKCKEYYCIPNGAVAYHMTYKSNNEVVQKHTLCEHCFEKDTCKLNIPIKNLS